MPHFSHTLPLWGSIEKLETCSRSMSWEWKKSERKWHLGSDVSFGSCEWGWILPISKEKQRRKQIQQIEELDAYTYTVSFTHNLSHQIFSTSVWNCVTWGPRTPRLRGQPGLEKTDWAATAVSDVGVLSAESTLEVMKKNQQDFTEIKVDPKDFCHCCMSCACLVHGMCGPTRARVLQRSTTKRSQSPTLTPSSA